MNHPVRFIIVTFSILTCFTVCGQRLIDKAAYVRFFSEAPLENIEAVNNEAMGVLDLSSGKVAVSMSMKRFKFEKSLMEEHFNENYIESDKFPKGTFSGTLVNFDQDGLSELTDSVSYVAKGDLTIHGVTKPLETEVWLKKEGEKLVWRTVFEVDVASFDIEIPKMVVMNIAEQVEVTAIFQFDLNTP